MARLLSIEDDPDTQHLIGAALFREGYEVHYAWNGQEGYEKVLELNPDLILLDLLLPIMNGVDFLKKLEDNKNTKNIPVIIVSGFGDEANLLGHSVVALGARAYLRKPVNIAELISRVKQVLTNSLPVPQSQPAPNSQDLRKGVVRADPKFCTVWVNDRLIATLPYKRFMLLRRLMENPGPVSAEQLLRDLGYEARQLNVLKQTVHRLRQDFGSSESRRIRTTPQGYELVG